MKFVRISVQLLPLPSRLPDGGQVRRPQAPETCSAYTFQPAQQWYCNPPRLNNYTFSLCLSLCLRIYSLRIS
jgi:hypothetical protein